MLRSFPLGLLALAAIALLGGCGGGGEGTALPATTPAPPQVAELGWVERHEGEDAALEFGVQRFEVTEDGWRADISIRNETSTRYAIGDERASLDRRFGVMLFKTGDLRELEQRNQADELPGLRLAQRFDPPLPAVLEPGAVWSGTMSAEGSLAAGLFARVVFGTLVPVDESPSGFPDRLVWITDNSYYLEGA